MKKTDKKYDWLFVESGSTTNGSIVQIMPNLTVKEMSKYIVNLVKRTKKEKENLYDLGTDALYKLIIRTNPQDNEIDSIYGYVLTTENTDYEAHILNRIKTVKI